MILYRFQFKGWVGFDLASNTWDDYSFQKPIDAVMQAEDIEWFLEKNPRKTFQVTTLMDEETHRNKAIDRFIQEELKRQVAESSNSV